MAKPDIQPKFSNLYVQPDVEPIFEFKSQPVFKYESPELNLEYQKFMPFVLAFIIYKLCWGK